MKFRAFDIFKTNKLVFGGHPRLVDNFKFVEPELKYKNKMVFQILKTVFDSFSEMKVLTLATSLQFLALTSLESAWAVHSASLVIPSLIVMRYFRPATTCTVFARSY